MTGQINHQTVNNKYTFYWNNGKREVLEGYSSVDALLWGGYSRDDLPNIQVLEYGVNDEYIWDGTSWKKKE